MFISWNVAQSTNYFNSILHIANSPKKRYERNHFSDVTLKHWSCAHVQVGPPGVMVSMLVLSVQMPEGDRQWGVRVLTQPERVWRKGGIKGWRRSGRGQRCVQLRQKSWVVQYHLWMIGWSWTELRDGADLNGGIWAGGGGSRGAGQLLRMGHWWQWPCGGDRLLERGGQRQARGGLERGMRKGGWWVSKRGGWEGGRYWGSWGLVTQICEVQSRAGRHTWKWQALHLWRNGGKSKRCGDTIRG